MPRFFHILPRSTSRLLNTRIREFRFFRRQRSSSSLKCAWPNCNSHTWHGQTAAFSSSSPTTNNNIPSERYVLTRTTHLTEEVPTEAHLFHLEGISLITGPSQTSKQITDAFFLRFLHSSKLPDCPTTESLVFISL